MRFVRQHTKSVSVEQLRHQHALLGEVINTGLIVAVATDVLNAYSSGRYPRLSSEALVAVAPPETALVAHATNQLAYRGLDAESIAALQMMTARLQMANRLTRGFIGLERRQDRATIDLDTLLDAWHGLCSVWVVVLYMLEHRLDGAQTPSSIARAAQIRDYLKAACAGDIFSVDGAGSITIPGWAERRRDPRMSCDISVALQTAGGIQMARLVNLSTGGAGVDGVTGLSVSSPVTIEIPDARRRMQGTVIWCRGETAGIAFHARLDRNDPLLAAVSNSRP